MHTLIPFKFLQSTVNCKAQTVFRSNKDIPIQCVNTTTMQSGYYHGATWSQDMHLTTLSDHLWFSFVKMSQSVNV